MSDVGVAVVGAGYFGRALARAVQAIPGARLVAITSRTAARAQAAAAELGARWVLDLEAVLADAAVQAVIVATPNHQHRDPVVLAAQAGKHVFCEKPMALSVADCDAMIAATRRAGVTLMLGHMQHFYDGVRLARTVIASGAIGTPIVARVERTGWEPARQQVSWKKMRAASGGHLFHHIHEIDLLLWFLGPVESVYARAANLAHRGEGYGDEDDVVLVSLRFRSGALATLDYGSAFWLDEHYVKVGGTLGGVVLDSKRARVVIRRAGEADQVEPLFRDPRAQASMLELFARTHGGITYGLPGETPPYFLQQAVEQELRVFVDAVAGRPIPEEYRVLFGGEAGRSAVEVAEAAMRSAALGEAVPLT